MPPNTPTDVVEANVPPEGGAPFVPEPQPTGERRFLSTAILIACLAIVALIGGVTLAYFGGFFKQSEPIVIEEAKTIAVIHFRQQHDAFVGLQDGLQKLGYDDVIIREWMITTGPDMNDQIERAVREAIEAGVDLIWASLEMQAKTALDMTNEMGVDIPIVFLSRFHDPVEYGLIGSFRSSGNNATGVVTNMIAVIERTIEFIKEINPEATRIGMFSDGFMVPEVGARYFDEWRTQAPRFGMEIVEYKTDVPPPEAEADFDRIAATIEPGDIDALVHIPGHFYELQEEGESRLAIRLGIPMSSPFEDMPNGGHFTYNDNFGLSGEQSVAMIDKIFRGMSPSDIPVEYGAEHMLMLHVGRANEAGYRFSDEMLHIATYVLENEADFARIRYYGDDSGHH